MVTFITGVAVSTALLALLVVPDLSMTVPTGGSGVASVSVPTGGSEMASVSANVGGIALTGGALVVGTLVWVAATGVLIERVSAAWIRIGSGFGRVISFLYPTSPMWRFAVIVMLLISLVLIVIGTIPEGIAAGP